MELQRLRNARGLKPSQLARLAGHHSVARLLSEVNIQTTPQPLTSSAAGVSTSAAPAEPLRRVARAALPTRQEPGRLSLEQGGISQEALLVALVQRAKLLLSLRAASLSLEGSPPESSAIGNEVRALSSTAGVPMDCAWSKFLLPESHQQLCPECACHLRPTDAARVG